MTTFSTTVFPAASGRLAIRPLASVLALVLAATLLAACQKGAREYKKGIAAYEDRDYATAVEYFTKGAEKGNPNAIIMLSCCMETGKGTPKNVAESEKWLAKLEDSRNPEAMLVYGAWCAEKREEAKGVEYIEKSAKKGCIMAQYILATYYVGKKDDENAVKWFKKAADHSLTKKKIVLDYTGLDRAFPFRMDLKHPNVTNQAIVCSQIMLGAAYMQGKGGLKVSKSKGKKWLKKASKNGCPEAENVLRQFEKD